MKNGEIIVDCLTRGDKIAFLLLDEKYRQAFVLIIGEYVGKTDVMDHLKAFILKLWKEHEKIDSLDKFVEYINEYLVEWGQMRLKDMHDKLFLTKYLPMINKAISNFLNTEPADSQFESPAVKSAKATDVAIADAFNLRDFDTAFNLLNKFYFSVMCVFAEYKLKWLHQVDREQVAKDMAQTVFIKMLENPPNSLRAESLKAYLLGSVFNAITDYKKHNDRNIRVDDTDDDEIWDQLLGPDQHLADDNVLAYELNAFIEKEISRLPKKQQQAIILFRDEYSIADIAEAMNMKYYAAEKNLKRAQKAVKQALIKKFGMKI